jgi:deoxyribose-phosphate aldolase
VSDSLKIPGCIDYTLFAPDATREDIKKLCAEAQEQNYGAVCVNGSRVELARAILDETELKVVALIGFPLGAADADAKRYETEIAVDSGAHEIDFVINLGRLKEGDSAYVLREMRDIVEAADERTVKAIIESHLLTHPEMILACQLAMDSGVQFISTASDFNSPNITAKMVGQLRGTLGETFGLKVSGNIDGLATAEKFLEAGATRIGLLAQ